MRRIDTLLLPTGVVRSRAVARACGHGHRPAGAHHDCRIHSRSAGPDLADGIVIHRVPHLHPDDVAIVDGLPVTSVARTLVDLAQDMSRDELRGVFMRAAELGLLDLDAVRACAGRVEWRPSLAMVHEVIEELAG